ncbi:MAG: hypothetical protein O2976_05970, partial [Actinomycetota bacterium]|nr:hypothetical protein [Actinomycetota bacterium]
TSIIVLIMGMVSRGLFQATSVGRFWRDDAIATKDLRQAASRFAADAMNTQTTSLVTGAPAVSSATLNWVDTANVAHQAQYAVVSGHLQRTLDGATISVARNVTDAQFSRQDRILTLTLTVLADQGATDSVTMRTYGRVLS